jgi:hypothetical protein
LIRVWTALIVFSGLVLFSSCDPSNQSSNENQNGNRNPANRNNNTADPLLFPSPPAPITSKDTVDPKFKPCNPYFPLIPGSTAKYILNYSSGLVANVSVVVDKGTENGRPIFVETEQIVDKDGGIHKSQTIVVKYACEADKVIILSQVSDNKADENETHVETRFSDRATAFPEVATIKTGTSWSHTIYQKFTQPGQQPVDSSKPMTFTFEVREGLDVSVPAGTFKTIRVVRKANGHDINEYYVKGLGLVKRQGEDGTRWELKEFSGLSAQE